RELAAASGHARSPRDGSTGVCAPAPVAGRAAAVVIDRHRDAVRALLGVLMAASDGVAAARTRDGAGGEGSGVAVTPVDGPREIRSGERRVGKDGRGGGAGRGCGRSNV